MVLGKASLSDNAYLGSGNNYELNSNTQKSILLYASLKFAQSYEA